MRNLYPLGGLSSIFVTRTSFKCRILLSFTCLMNNQGPNTFVGDLVAFSFFTPHSEVCHAHRGCLLGVPNCTSHHNMRASKYFVLRQAEKTITTGEIHVTTTNTLLNLTSSLLLLLELTKVN